MTNNFYFGFLSNCEEIDDVQRWPLSCEEALGSKCLSLTTQGIV